MPSGKLPSKSEKLKVQVWIYRSGIGGGESQVLMLLTRPGRGEFWQPVTGGVEEGEDVLAAALREAREETGLDFTEHPETLEYEFSFHRDAKTFREFTFSLMAPSNSDAIQLDPHEHVDYRWVSSGEALKMLKHESNALALKKFLVKQSKKNELTGKDR